MTGETRERGGGERRSFRREGEPGEALPGESPTPRPRQTTGGGRVAVGCGWGWCCTGMDLGTTARAAGAKGGPGVAQGGPGGAFAGLEGTNAQGGRKGWGPRNESPRKPHPGSTDGGPAGTGGTSAEDPCGTAHHLPWGDSNRCKEVGPWLLSGRWCRLGLPRAPQCHFGHCLFFCCRFFLAVVRASEEGVGGNGDKL